MSESAHLTSGTVVNDRYRIDSKLGTGGYSEVLAARDLSEDREVALKVLHGEATDHDPRAVERMRQEAEILRAVSHPNIVRIFEVDTFDGGQFLVMEHIEGIGLDELLDQEGVLASARLLPLVRQLLDALGAAHETEILHRDLKPDNVLVTDEEGRETIKLVDFGVAKAGALLNADDFEEGVTLVKTRSGTFVGTPRYAAPEMVVGDPPGPASDLFCVGLIVYEALVGEPLVQGDSRSELINDLVFPRPFDLSAVPEPWARWLEAILEKSPEHRPAGSGEALQRLDELFSETDRAPSTVESSSRLDAGDDGGETDDEAPVHPKFGDSAPATKTQTDTPPDFEALDAAAADLSSSPAGDAADPDLEDSTPLELADVGGAEPTKPPPETEAEDPAETAGVPHRDPESDPNSESSASPDRDAEAEDDSSAGPLGSILLFVLVALAVFALAALLLMVFGTIG